MPGLKKVREHFLLSLLRLLFVNALHQDMLVLQLVTLHLHVHVVVHVFVNLLDITVLVQKPAQHRQAPQP
jgi:hypothetical protein